MVCDLIADDGHALTLPMAMTLRRTDIWEFRYVGHNASDLNLRFIIFIIFVLHAECKCVHHRQEDERRHVRSLGHLSASELAARVLTRAFHQRWYYDEFGKLPLPPKRQISSLIERLK